MSPDIESVPSFSVYACSWYLIVWYGADLPRSPSTAEDFHEVPAFLFLSLPPLNSLREVETGTLTGNSMIQ